jgi:hypothetical protein
MHSRLSRQSGMTLLGFMLMFVALGFVMLITLKLMPIYLEHYKIQTSLNNLKTDPDVTGKTPTQIIAMLQKRWDVNGVDRIQAKDAVSIERKSDSLKIEVSYEVEEHLLGNVSALVKFDNFIELGDQN